MNLLHSGPKENMEIFVIREKFSEAMISYLIVKEEIFLLMRCITFLSRSRQKLT